MFAFYPFVIIMALLEIINQLKNNNVSIYFEKEKIDTAVEYNQFLLETYAALAQNEVENISQATRWGIEKKLLQGKPKFIKLLGYDVVTIDNERTLKINEEKETVLTIYNLFLKGYVLKEIARYLIKHGYKTSYGNDVWYGSTVKNILTNVIYTGNYLTSDKSKDLFTKKITYGERIRYLIKNTHPAIISMDVFEEVQKRLEEISPRYQSFKKRNKHSLSGRMRCGCCDYSLIVHSRHGYHYWKCYPSILHKCHFQSIREDTIPTMMLNAFMERFNFNYSGVRKKLFKILEKINQNDHFEFHRLKYFAEITIAEQQLSKSKVEQLRQAYL